MMALVAAVAIAIAAFRTHFSLGSFVACVVSFRQACLNRSD